MKIKEEFLRRKENVEEEDEICPERDWLRKMEPDDKFRYMSMLVLDPMFVALLFYYLTGIQLNILFIYVLVDVIIVIWCRGMEIKRLKKMKELEMMGDRMPIILQKIQELKELEAEIKKSGNQ